MKQWFRFLLFTFTLWLPQLETAVAQQADVLVVRAILFMSPTCGHCHYVITELLLPMTEEYGDQLEILMIDVTQPAGNQFYQQAISYYEIPEERLGVPTLIIGEVVLVGSGEIPDQFPGLVANGLASGGIDWPDLPGLADVLTAVEKPTPLPTAPLPTALPVTREMAEGEDTAVYLAYFYDPACLACAQVSKDLAHLQTQYPNLVVRAYDLRQEATLNEAFCEKYGVPGEERLLAPAVFIGSQCLTNEEISQERLSGLIQDPEPAALLPPWEDEDFAVLCELLEEPWPMVPVSATAERNFAALKQAIYQQLDIMRIYSKPPGKEPDRGAPFVLPQGSTLEEFAAKVHRDFVDQLKSARVWGTGVFDGQMVGRDHMLHDGDVVELPI